jgi:hypothetical protein
MLVPNSPSHVTSLHHPLDPALIGSRQEEEREPAVRRAPAPAEPQVRAMSRPGLAFKAVVRANLHAAAQHAILGHKAPSFRECPHASCRNASNLVPYPVVVEAGVTDADLEEIFQRVVPAALEKAAASPAPIRITPEWRNELAFVS